MYTTETKDKERHRTRGNIQFEPRKKKSAVQLPVVSFLKTTASPLCELRGGRVQRGSTSI